MTEIVKFAIGEIVACHPLDGVMYGSAGAMMTLLAIGVAGGNANTEYLVLSTRAAAIPARSVEMAAISPPSISDRDKVQAIHEHVLEVYCPFYKVKADNHRSSLRQMKVPDVTARYLLKS
jgi:hypothetical protein